MGGLDGGLDGGWVVGEWVWHVANTAAEHLIKCPRHGGVEKRGKWKWEMGKWEIGEENSVRFFSSVF